MTDIVTYKFIELLDEHKTAIPIDHPDRSVTRSKLEYPTENVSFAYLSAIDKLTTSRTHQWTDVTVLTADNFTDKAVQLRGNCNKDFYCRFVNTQNSYILIEFVQESSKDFEICKIIDGTTYDLATESVDLYTRGGYLVKFEVCGSTLNAYRDDMRTPKISATDTDLSSGKFGFRTETDAPSDVAGAGFVARHLAPATSLPRPLAIIEVEIIGAGSEKDPFRPNLIQDLKEVLELPNVPDYVKREAKRYEVLKKKGFTDEEIELVLGYIPQHQVDLASVTWGAFELNPKHPTVIITVTGGNFYTGDDAITKQVEHAKSRGLRVLNPPSDYREAVEQYNMLKKDYSHWLAGKDNYAYQVLGWEVLELFQVADFYYGELIEHKTHYDQLKQVPDWELRRTIERWYSRLKQVNVLIEERDKHLKKLEEVLKLGW